MKNLFWKWEKAVPPAACEVIKSQFSDSSCKIAQVGNGTIDPERRNSDISWLKPNDWVEGILYNHVRYANQSAGWNFDINGIEAIQLTRYRQGQFYEWHSDRDILDDSGDKRKLSVVLLLSDPSEYQGGGLFLQDFSDNLLQNQGDLVVFPSFLVHKAAEVTDGVRMTAVGWVTGPAFK